VAAEPAGSVIIGDDGLARPAWASTDPLMREYYDHEWGLPVTDEQGLYERICLEGFQAGLSWATILRKRPAFRAAFAGFNPEAVALFTADDVERLLQDPGIIRNRLKIVAAIKNAQATLALRQEGGLVEFVWQFSPASTPIFPPSPRNRWHSRKPSARRASPSSAQPPCLP
jgi:DNA-3-methyladenine glycosylase I